MNKETRNIDRKAIKNSRSNGSENDLTADSKDSALFSSVSEYMKGYLDIEDVKNDPAFSDANEEVKEMISDYRKSTPRYGKNEEFIRKVFSGMEAGKRINDDIKSIKQESQDNRLNEITAEWVKEWHEKKQKIGKKDPKTEEIREFITNAINSTENEPVKTLDDGREKGSVRSLFVRYASLAAAALIGVFILIKALLPSSDPEKLFNKYYKPFDAISPVTRSMSINEPDSYSSGISSYKSGNWQQATVEFAVAVKKDPDGESQRFFLGLSQLALENHDQAINLFTGVINDSGEYGKEARWYLGLTLLKTGNKEKATECFDYLSKSPGFYQERADEILRRLK